MVQVVDRVGALLGAFSQERPVLGLAECAERSGLSKSSAHRLLTSLVEIGLLERDAAGNWQIGELPLRLAAIRLSHRNMRLEVVAALVHLGQRFQAATAFSVPNGGEMVYVERTDSVIPFAPSVRLGSTAPMWTGAAGRAVLSLLEPLCGRRCATRRSGPRSATAPGPGSRRRSRAPQGAATRWTGASSSTASRASRSRSAARASPSPRSA